MARRPTPPPALVPAQLSHQEMRAGIERLRQTIAELEAFNVGSITQRNDPAVLALEKSIEETLQRVFRAGTIEQQRYSAAATLHHQSAVLFVPFSGGRGPSGPSPGQIQGEFATRRSQSIALLGAAIKGFEKDLQNNDQFAPPAGQKGPTRKVFIVHGHEGEPREAVSGFLRKINFTPVILGEQTNQGRTIVEKFEAHSDVNFAVVLLTPDDVGGRRGEDQQPRARQNVILELGYFIGKLGRKNVCAIKLGNLEIPSDFIGVVWTPFDLHGAWKTALAKELKEAGHEIDWNKVMGP
jgi:predicted nucleotide-binding protein